MSTYTDDQRDDAIEAYQKHGAREAGRLVGIPHNTISRWAARAGIDGPVQPKGLQTFWAARMEETADNLTRIALAATGAVLDAIERDGAEVKCRDAVGAWTRAIHDYQLLTGQATERVADDAKERVIAQMDELKARKQRNAEAA